MSSLDPRPIFVLEMANNHMGSVAHGALVIRSLAEVTTPFADDFRFAFKLQYRDLDTLIHPRHRENRAYKYIKRFTETRLSPAELASLKAKIDALGFLSVCTPFDERSVDLIEEHRFAVVKIPSCSFTDWPLLERIALTQKPLIASTAGASIADMDRVLSFFLHRGKEICLMHCVAEYPTPAEHLDLNQIELLRTRYPGIRVGYSTHELPDETASVQMAVAKGATIFEKHVGVAADGITLNAYSASPEQAACWLAAARNAFRACGVAGVRKPFAAAESESLRSLRRGVYAARNVDSGEAIHTSDVFLAMPVQPGQLTANDLSKYIEIHARTPVSEGEPLLEAHVELEDHREQVYAIVQRVKDMLRRAGTVVPARADFEISHHFGIENFDQTGATLITVINRDYCKKLIVMLPGQAHPAHRHRVKDETFLIVYGSVTLVLDGVSREYRGGELIVVESGVQHSFETKTGVVIEELSSTHARDDSFYDDAAIPPGKDRKTQVTYWLE